MAHDSQIASDKDNIKVSHVGSSQRKASDNNPRIKKLYVSEDFVPVKYRGKRELYCNCLPDSVMWLSPTVPLIGLQCRIVIFPDQTLLLY